jgi:hypothetical protein
MKDDEYDTPVARPRPPPHLDRQLGLFRVFELLPPPLLGAPLVQRCARAARLPRRRRRPLLLAPCRPRRPGRHAGRAAGTFAEKFGGKLEGGLEFALLVGGEGFLGVVHVVDEGGLRVRRDDKRSGVRSQITYHRSQKQDGV